MKTFRSVLAITVAGLLGGCDRLSSEGSVQTFQLVASAKGEMYLLNLKSGKVSLVARDGVQPLGDVEPIIRVGHYYPLEDPQGDVRFVHYKGKGLFESAGAGLPAGWSVKEDPK